MDNRLAMSPMVQAVLLAETRPRDGIPLLLKLIREAQKEGRTEDGHVLADSLVGAAIRAKVQLALAERIAKHLATERSDKHHLEKLARVLDLRGKKREAAAVRRKAARAPDEHMTPEIAEAIAQAEREAKGN